RAERQRHEDDRQARHPGEEPRLLGELPRPRAHVPGPADGLQGDDEQLADLAEQPVHPPRDVDGGQGTITSLRPGPADRADPRASALSDCASVRLHKQAHTYRDRLGGHKAGDRIAAGQVLDRRGTFARSRGKAYRRAPRAPGAKTYAGPPAITGPRRGRGGGRARGPLATTLKPYWRDGNSLLADRQ